MPEERALRQAVINTLWVVGGVLLVYDIWLYLTVSSQQQQQQGLGLGLGLGNDQPSSMVFRDGVADYGTYTPIVEEWPWWRRRFGWRWNALFEEWLEEHPLWLW